MREKYKTIDLCAGIGGIRLGFEMTNRIKNIFSVERDKFAIQTYIENFGDNPAGDCSIVNPLTIEDFDILLAGFPCQAFSIAGARKGFEDTRGTVFFEIARFIRDKKPKAFLLENVRGLLNHKKGETFKTILSVLKDLEYNVHYKVLKAEDFGLPQKRQRIFIVGFRRDLNITDFTFPEPLGIKTSFKDVKEKEPVSVKYYLSTVNIAALKRHKERHQSKGNGFGYEIIQDEDIANTLMVGGMGREKNLVIDNRLTNFEPITRIKGEVNKEGLRYMTPREWARLQGYPDSFKIPVSDSQAYKQFGNSVPVPVIYYIAKNIITTLDSI